MKIYTVQGHTQSFERFSVFSHEAFGPVDVYSTDARSAGKFARDLVDPSHAQHFRSFVHEKRHKTLFDQFMNGESVDLDPDRVIS